ncbi:unnamed protein product [Clonostachys rosea f. rosea IK726]|uniref:Uncharacterized protein n=2 Tax=Clonostachys rosea f. rosea IK726 TaxID=1349383 RepID=A0ACA9UKU3_BIOOC|nr:unnamed protein product [Clonostachys rosea f. rosea IK726]CAG9953979.1 unnamed protein product [Clonostachys rosea f. rosea IK726]
MSNPLNAESGIKAVFFDFMGTCLDWHTSIVNAFPAALSEKEKSDLALEWRQAFFDAIRSRPPGETPEDIDITHTRLLKEVLARLANAAISQRFHQAEDGDQTKAVKQAVQAWHQMDSWPDVQAGLKRIRAECGCELFVLANGTTRLQLDLVRSSRLNFDMLFSSQLLGASKPTLAVYRKAMTLVGIQDSGQAVMVAAHAYDLRAAKQAGLKTVYIQRWTDDLDETDRQRLHRENNGNVLDDFDGLSETIKRL